MSRCSMFATSAEDCLQDRPLTVANRDQLKVAAACTLVYAYVSQLLNAVVASFRKKSVNNIIISIIVTSHPSLVGQETMSK